MAAAWTRKEGKRESGGLNQKGVESYRRENPGSKLKTAVTRDPSKLKKGGKAAKRRASFCARMKGMKKRRTSAKTANDPNSRINKSLRAWNCESLEKVFEFGRYKLASGLIVNTQRGRYKSSLSIEDPDSGTIIKVGGVRKSKAKGQGSTWDNVDIESSGIRMGKMRTKRQLKKRSGKKIIRELAKHAAHTKKKGRPLRIEKTHIVNPKLAKALEKAYKNPRFSKTVGDIEVGADYSGRKARLKGNTKDHKAEGRRRVEVKENEKRERKDRRLDEQGRLTDKRVFRSENRRRKNRHLVQKVEDNPKRNRRNLVLIKDKNRA